MMHHLVGFGLIIALISCRFAITAPSATPQRSSPLQIPDDAQLVQKQFRTITFTFKKAG